MHHPNINGCPKGKQGKRRQKSLRTPNCAQYHPDIMQQNHHKSVNSVVKIDLCSNPCFIPYKLCGLEEDTEYL